ncbi:2,3-diaminopropionate biosynthesis protein SbnA [Laceyella tengchongensis]|jgi:N-(2-amino-2-carboxyethyl)-L-glutamate synthase|uniref:2,3-diaminopropionate biosynthesis protein SbnA n=1 Tax=Laceyella tengchongensis TaxID=574699 RepID=UPI0012B9603A|nr:2,3-diaminopropionate biosynthesis protein SbnA [Laceyella tengchongensis]
MPVSIHKQDENKALPSSIIECVGNTPLVSLRRLFAGTGVEVFAKLEYMNPGGSMKDRPARFMIEQGLRDGTITADSHIIESSSGNLGVAIAMVARVYGLPFTCVVDPKTAPSNLKILSQLGAKIEMVTEADDQGGYLKTRIRRVQELLHSIPNAVWMNQYANERNWQAHYYGTGSEMAEQLPQAPDCLIAAVSTSGSILGCARRLRETYPDVKVIAVDAVGSVIFGTPPKRRELPGIGSSRVPEILVREEIDDVIHVNDRESVEGCRDLLYHEGIFAGGSSGSVIAAIKKLIPTVPKPYRICTILPDRGDRYLDMVYDEDWVDRLPTT